jgi:hypothetical protein
VFTSNINIVSYIVIEYAEFMIKYFRDIEFAKKLLKTYFESSVYNEYLFLSYLEFFINHVEYKENSKDSKETYEDFVGIICNGLGRAFDNTPEKYKSLKKIVQKYLRDYIVSIYSIKASEKRIKESELQAHKRV